MKNEVSALMDGELEVKNVSQVIEIIDKNSELKQCWETYHLIGDALKQSPRLSMNLSEVVTIKLKDEAIIYSPNASQLLFRKQKRKIATLALAASVVLGISTWLGLNQYSQETDKQIFAEKKAQETGYSAAPITVSSQLQPIKNGSLVFERNDFLFLQNEVHPIYTNYANIQKQNINTPQFIEYHKSEATK